MTFKEASDLATRGLTLSQIGNALGVSWIRQARVDPNKAGYRPPPVGWETILADLVRRRASELNDLADELGR